jgi:hypothetical protein
VATRSFSRGCILAERSNKFQLLQHISLDCSYSKESVTIKVANVITGAFWPDRAALILVALDEFKSKRKILISQLLPRSSLNFQYSWKNNTISLIKFLTKTRELILKLRTQNCYFLL